MKFLAFCLILIFHVTHQNTEGENVNDELEQGDQYPFREKRGTVKREAESPKGWKKLPPKKCKTVSGRKKRGATTTFEPGELLHITAYHPDAWKYCLHVSGGEPENISPIGIHSCIWHAKPYIWTFDSPPWAPDKTWATIKSLIADQCLDVTNAWTTNGSPIGVYDCIDGADNQLWKVLDNGDGTVFLQEYFTCKCLSIVNVKDNKKQTAELSDCVGKGKRPDQVWTLKQIARGHLTLFEKVGWKGKRDYISSNGECVAFPEELKGKVNAVDSHNTCMMLYEKDDCKGRSLKPDYKKGEAKDLNKANFGNLARSAKSC